ncbi:MAG: DUF7093 family protein [Halodesulfurarchaeum sp.]
MGLRCSLFGHDFGDTVTERDRNENGAEVVITVRKIRSCRRCGAEEVVTENTEIRHRESLEESSVPENEGRDADHPGGLDTERSPGEIDGGTEPEPDTERPRQPSPGGTDESEHEPTVPDLVESAESTEDERWKNESDGKGSVTERDDKTDVVDDAIIMGENVEGDVDRENDLGRRELVDSGNMFDTSPPEAGNGDDFVDPGRNGGIEGGSTENRTAEESEMDRGDSGTDSIDEDPSEDREAIDPDDSTFEFDDTGPSGERSRERNVDLSGSGITAAGPIDVSGSPSDGLDATFVCPECRYSARAAGSSLRAGDICPNCRQGYLAERR